MSKDDEVIFERGKPIKKREDLNLLQIILADDAARSLKKIASSQEKEQFLGRVEPKGFICTGTTQLVDLLKQPPFIPWAKVNFYNAGPNTALVSINNAYDWNSIDPSDQLEMDFLKADKRLQVIYYKCNETGETANVTATGKW